ncbi:hypothetical protein ACFZAU_38525 [Streptomyces sp. NPDC008238]
MLGTLPRTDSTIEAALAIVRGLARFLTGTCNKRDWALTDVHDVEAFLTAMPKARQRRLTVLRQQSADLRERGHGDGSARESSRSGPRAR